MASEITDTSEVKRKVLKQSSVGSEKIKPKKHKLGIAAKIGIAAAVGIAAFEGGGMAYSELTNNEPISGHTLQADAMHPWDIGLENILPTFDNNAETNYIKAGNNAAPASQENVQQLLNQKPPVLTKPEVGGYAPIAKMLLPFNPENAKNVKIVKEYLQMRNSDSYYYGIENVFIQGQDVPVYIPLIEGAKNVNIKAWDYGYGIIGIDMDYSLNDGQKWRVTLNFADTNFAPTDILKNIPKYNPSTFKNS